MSPAGSKQIIEDDRIEALRLVLEKEQHQAVSYSEAREVGEALMSFYEVLADGAG